MLHSCPPGFCEPTLSTFLKCGLWSNLKKEEQYLILNKIAQSYFKTYVQGTMKIKFKSSFQQCCLFFLACYSPDKAKKVIYKASPMHSMGYRTHGGKVDSTPGKSDSFCLLFGFAIVWRNHTQILLIHNSEQYHLINWDAAQFHAGFLVGKPNWIWLCVIEPKIIELWFFPLQKIFSPHWGKLQLCLSLLHYVYPHFVGPIVQLYAEYKLGGKLI